MIPGVGAGDFWTAIKLANDIRKNYRDAPKQFEDLFNELRSLSIILHDVDVLCAGEDLEASRAEQLQQLRSNCESILIDIEQHLHKYFDLDKSVPTNNHRLKRTWKRLTWEPKDIGDLRNRLISNTALLSAFHSTSISTNTIAVRKKVDQLGNKVDQVIDQQELDRREMLFRWISDLDHTTYQTEALSRHLEGTGDWFLRSKEVSQWLDNPASVLFCSGAPGAGKTVLHSLLLNEVSQKSLITQNTGIAYFYFNYNRAEEQSTLKVLSSMLIQLLRSNQEISSTLNDQHASYLKLGKTLSLQEVLGHIRGHCTTISRTYIFLDALDECEEECRNTVMQHLLDLRDTHGVNLFATSRVLPAISDLFPYHKDADSSLPEASQEYTALADLKLTIRADDADIYKYLETGARSMNIVRRNPSLISTIVQKIVAVVDGSFLLAKLHLDSIKTKITLKSLTTALAKLPKGSAAYDSAYLEAMERIKSQTHDYSQLAISALTWIAFAKRRLSVEELIDALAVEESSTKLDPNNRPHKDDILTACLGLVVSDGQHITLVHETTREFFARNEAKLFGNAQAEIAQTCIQRLLFHELSVFSGFEETVSGLVGYAAGFWGYHVHDSHSYIPDALSLLQNQRKLNLAANANRLITQIKISKLAPKEYRNHFSDVFTRKPYPTFEQTLTSSLHECARFNLANFALECLKGCNDPNMTIEGQTALYDAIMCQSLSVAKCLLTDERIDPTVGNIFAGESSLHAAAEVGSVELIRQLLEDSRVDPFSKNRLGQMPVHLAAKLGRTNACLELLKVDGTDPMCVDGQGNTLLHLAVESEQVDLVSTLLSNPDIDPNVQNNSGQTPVQKASLPLKAHVFQAFLMDRRVELNLVNDQGETPLLHVVKSLRMRDEKFLVTIGKLFGNDRVDINLCDRNGSSALQLVIQSYPPHITYHVLDSIRHRGSTVSEFQPSESIQDSREYRELRDTVSHMSPMIIALKSRHFEVAKYLLKRGFNPMARDQDGSSGLFLALSQQPFDLELVSLLLHDGVDIDERDPKGRTIIDFAAEGKDVSVLKKLLEFGELPTKSVSGTVSRQDKLRFWKQASQMVEDAWKAPIKARNAGL